jgi:membrane protein YdbS with pleckstrin-like domain
MRLFEAPSGPPVSAMNYLLPVEQLVITLRQHPAKLLPDVAMAVGGLLAAVAVSVISHAPQGAYLAVWLLELFLILRAVWHVASWAVQYLAVTQKRLILTSGLLGRKVTALPLAALQNLAFSRSLGGRIFGYGAFTFEADGQAWAVIDYIPYPDQIYLEIYHLLYPEDAGEDAGPGEDGSPGEGADPGGDGGLDFDDL